MDKEEFLSDSCVLRPRSTVGAKRGISRQTYISAGANKHNQY